MIYGGIYHFYRFPPLSRLLPEPVHGIPNSEAHLRIRAASLAGSFSQAGEEPLAETAPAGRSEIITNRAYRIIISVR